MPLLSCPLSDSCLLISQQMSDAMMGNIADSQQPDASLGPGSEADSSATPSSMAEPQSSSSAVKSAEDFIVVDRQCAIEAMAFFIAETLMSCPQAASLQPAKLQEAVLIAVQVKI